MPDWSNVVPPNNTLPNTLPRILVSTLLFELLDVVPTPVDKQLDSNRVMAARNVIVVFFIMLWILDCKFVFETK